MHELDDKISANKGLIFKQINKMHLFGDPEAESIGYMALYNALNTYEPDKNVALSTYATVCIYNALGVYIRELNRKRQLELVSYNAPAFADSKEEFVDHLPVHIQTISPEDAHIKNEYLLFIQQVVQEELERLTNLTIRKVVKVWVMSEYTKDTKEIAKEAGVSQSYVSQVLNRFRYSLRKRLEEYNE